MFTAPMAWSRRQILTRIDAGFAGIVGMNMIQRAPVAPRAATGGVRDFRSIVLSVTAEMSITHCYARNGWRYQPVHVHAPTRAARPRRCDRSGAPRRLHDRGSGHAETLGQ